MKKTELRRGFRGAYAPNSSIPWHSCAFHSILQSASGFFCLITDVIIASISFPDRTHD
jgi:hypothetical protein